MKPWPRLGAALFGPVIIVLVLGVLASTGGALLLHARNEATQDDRLRATAASAVSALRMRMQLYEYGLQGARGTIIGAGDQLSRERFRRYAESRDLGRAFPGALGYGFIRRVAPASEAQFLADARRDGAPDFAIRAFAPHPGDRFITQYVEPARDNGPAIGLDVGSEPVRRAAAVAAMATGASTLTAPIELVQLPADATGFLMFLPVYRDAAPASSAPEREVVGWVYAALGITRLLHDFDYRGGEFTMSIADVSGPGDPVAIFPARGASRGAGAPLTVRTTLPMYGRAWRVEIHATPVFLAHLDLRSPWLLGAGGMGFAALLACLLYTVQSGLRRRLGLGAEQQRAEAELRASEQRFRDLAESIPHIVWTSTGDGDCDYMSPQWVVYTGLREPAGLGRTWLEQIHPDDVGELQARWSAATARGGVFDVQCRLRRGDGVYRWFQTRATPIRDAAGHVVKWFGSNTDIQDLRDAQAVSAQLTQDLEARVLARTDELRAANAQLASAARQLQDAQRLTHVGSWELSVADDAVRWSEELYRIAGMDPQQAAPAYPDQERIFTPESWAMLSAAVKHSIATGDGYELTLEVVRPDGEHRTAIARAEAVLGATGVMEKLVGTFQDVTELARARTELVTQSERQQVATLAARLGIWDWNLRTNVVVWDDMMHCLYDTRRDDFAGAYETWLSGIHPDDLAMVQAELQGALAGTAEIHTEFRIVWKTGEVRYVHPAATVQRDPDTGQPLRVIGANWDVTEQRVAELALRSTEALQRGILAHAGSSIIATDREGTITLFNHAAEVMLGYTAQEVVGRATPALIHDAEEVSARTSALEHELGRPVSSPIDVFIYQVRPGGPQATEWVYLRKDGSRVPVLLTISVLRDDAGEIFGYLGVAVDLTSRKQHETELVELNRLLAERSAQAESASQAKSMFLANMSHEIRTPMNAITGVTYLLRQTQLSPDQRDLVRTLQSGTKALLGMINDILDLSKIEARQLTLEEGPFQLSQVLDDLGAMMAALAADKRLELVVETDAAAPARLIGDAMRLTQILNNLVGNAIKFTDAGTVRIGVRVSASDDTRTWLRFEVQDTGAGIDEASLHRLFTPFTQVDQPGARRPGGTGLGLAIVKQLVTLMGGEVGVESTLGTGSVFWCRIPFARVASAQPAAWPQDLELLLVEPHDGQRAVLAAYARRCGWRVHDTATNDHVVAQVHEQAAAGRPFDAIILDCSPPGLRGLPVLLAIRASTGLARQPAVILTTVRDAAALRSHPADAVLCKPITSSSLFNAVTEAVTGRTGAATHVRDDDVVQGDRGQRLAGMRILVVDDSKLNQIVVSRLMEREGALVEIAGNGLEAVAHAEAAAGTFDAVLMDVQMPELDGVEATRRIRGLPGCAHLPIIAVTAGAMASERQLALDAGVNEVISKPFDPEVVIASVRRYIHQVRERGIPVPVPVPLPCEATPAAWPVVDGIDARDVALRLDGDVAMFHVLLGLFVGDLDELERALATPPSGAQVIEIAQRLHKLRGTAGNLGARDLYACATQAEQALRADQMPAALEGLGRVREQLARLRRSVVAWLDAPPPGALLASGAAAAT